MKKIIKLETLLFVLITTISFIGCDTPSSSENPDNKETNKIEDIFTSQTKEITADIENLGINATSVISNNPEVATAVLVNKVITIKSKTEGTTKVIASDNSHSATISVSVSNSGSISVSIAKYIDTTVTLVFKIDSKGRFEDNTYGTKTITGNAGNPITGLPTVTAIDGYELAWWEPEIPENFPNEDTTYTAIFSEATYTVTYHLNGGTATGSNPTDFVWGTSYITLTAPTRIGYTFSGWSYTNEGVSSSMTERVYVNNINNINNGNLDLYALWKPNTYYIILTPHASSGEKLSNVVDEKS